MRIRVHNVIYSSSLYTRSRESDGYQLVGAWAESNDIVTQYSKKSVGCTVARNMLSSGQFTSAFSYLSKFVGRINSSLLPML